MKLRKNCSEEWKRILNYYFFIIYERFTCGYDITVIYILRTIYCIHIFSLYVTSKYITLQTTKFLPLMIIIKSKQNVNIRYKHFACCMIDNTAVKHKIYNSFPYSRFL